MLVPMKKIIKGLGKTATNLMPNTPEEFIKLGFITVGLYSGDIECLYAAVSFTLLNQWLGPKAREAHQLEALDIVNESNTKIADSTSEEERNTVEKTKAQSEPSHTLPETEVNTGSAQMVETETLVTSSKVGGVLEEKSSESAKAGAQVAAQASSNQTAKTEASAVKYFTSPQAAYKAGVAMFNAHEHDTAIEYLEDAIVLYQKEYSPISKQVATCFSTLSSCYRELAKTESNSKERTQLHNEAIRFLDQAIAISLLIETMSEEEKSKLLDKKKTVLEGIETQDKALSIYASAIRTLAGKEFQQPCMTEHVSKLVNKAEKMGLSINYEKLAEEQIRELELPEATINALLISKINPEARKHKAALLSTINDAGFAELQKFFADPKNAEKAVELQRKFLNHK